MFLEEVEVAMLVVESVDLAGGWSKFRGFKGGTRWFYCKQHDLHVVVVR